MKPAGQNWRSLFRFAVCGLLLLWIFHAIFVYEGRLAWERQGLNWSSLSRAEQWRAAWSNGPRGLWNTLSLVDSGALFASFLLMGATVFLGIARWRMILKAQGLELSFGRASEISLVAHFFNSFLLGSTGGDLMKAYYAARETHHKKAEAVTTVFVDRLIGLFAMLLFAAVMMPFNSKLLMADTRFIAVAGVILTMLAGSAAVGGLAFWGGLSRSFPQAREWLRRLPKGASLECSLMACRDFGKKPWLLLQSLAVSMLLNAVCVCQFIVLASGLKLGVSTSALFLIVPSIISISALPITPSGLGVRENLFVQMLAVRGIGVEATGALSLSLLAYAGSLAWSVIGGIVYSFLKDRHQLQQVSAVSDAKTEQG